MKTTRLRKSQIAKRILLFLSILLGVFNICFMFYLRIKATGSLNLDITLVIMVILTSFFLSALFCYLFYQIIIEVIIDKEKKEDALKIVKENLSDTYQEVYYIQSYVCGEVTMISAIVSHSGACFFAKLLPDNAINLIVFDSNRKKIYESKISDMQYFLKHFKFEN